MGAVDTTYTFTATDTITSAKMNNIIDQTTITSDAILGTTLEVASGKLKIRSQGVTSNEMAANSVTNTNVVNGAITPDKLSTYGPTWDSASTSIKGERVYLISSNVVNGSTGLEIGQGNTIDQFTFIDFHASATGGLYSDGDANVRIYRNGGLNGEVGFINSGTGQMRFEQAGAFEFNGSGGNRMYISESGIVNIPNSLSVGPGSQLVDRVTSNGPIAIFPGTTNAYSDAVELQNRTNTYLSFVGSAGQSDFAYLRQIGTGSNDLTISLDLHDDPNNASGGQAFAIRQISSSAIPDTITTNFIVDKLGNVGIGTDNPVDFNPNARSLHIRGTTDAAVLRTETNTVQGDFFSSQDSVVLRSGTNHPLIFATNATERARISASGNVGIGTSSPASKLDVNGTVTATTFSGPLTGTASGNIRQGGGAGQGTNTIYMGWDNASKIRVQVDSTNFGSTWPIDVSGTATTALNVSNGVTSATVGTVAEMKAETAAKLVAADIAKHLPGVAKAYGSVATTSGGRTFTAGYNVASVAKSGASLNITQVTFTQNMASALYVVTTSGTYTTAGGVDLNYTVYDKQTTGFKVYHQDESSVRGFDFAVFGTLA